MEETQAGRATGLSRRSVLIGIAGAGAVAGVLIWRRIPPNYQGGKLSVSDAHAVALDGSVLLIDIRTPKEWRQTGVGEGAQPLDMRRNDFVDALSRLSGGDTHQPIALICARGVRSARLSRRLTDAGFTSIIDVPEGMLGSGAGPGWLATGLPVNPWTGEQV
ncbi:rhodanese-like domain-containing protein [Phaeobacter marinintestinus]|uniref:rhodanese-like domain-containing protein n=1 Tax=Falsiphaeobacter marinintestinus TaxID=1492905 RepID=UPI0011B71510|nr:rhodanese-like domain-containing protein [Phaeobacter marinintestinus]